MDIIINNNQLFKCNAYLGQNRRNWNSNMNLFIIGHKYDIYFINLKYTLFLFKKNLNILYLNSKENILMLLPQDFNNVLLFTKLRGKKFIKYCSNINIIYKWTFGILSNYFNFKDKLKLPFPKILFIFPNLLDNIKYLSVLNEIRKYNMISMGFISTSDNPYILDYFVPINNNSTELLKLYFRLILVYLCTLNFKNKYLFFKKIIRKVKNTKINKKIIK
jgi:ribosomal protein S2